MLKYLEGNRLMSAIHCEKYQEKLKCNDGWIDGSISAKASIVKYS